MREHYCRICGEIILYGWLQGICDTCAECLLQIEQVEIPPAVYLVEEAYEQRQIQA